MAFINLTKKIDNINANYSRKSLKHKGRSRFLAIVLILIVALIIPSIFIFLGFKGASFHSKGIATAYQNQNFDQIKQEVVETKNSLNTANFALNFIFWLRIIPIIGGYYSDIKGLTSGSVEQLKAVETLLTELKSSEKELGFSGQVRAGQDRVTQGIKVLEKSLPHLDKVKSNFKKSASLVSNIDTNKYPENFRGIAVKRLLTTLKNFMVGSAVAAFEGYPALSMAPSALGDPTSKNYLLLFQNDKEIRATGGFITAYASLKVDKGQVQTTTSDDIYRLDERLLATCQSKICPLTPPPPIVKYLPEVTGKARSAWSMRDSNMSADVPSSAKEFERIFQLLGQGLPFDGIIFIDSQVVEELIDVTGPIDVLGTKYSAEKDERCNCPNVIYELESYAEIAAKGEQDRKAILGVLMQQILARSVGADLDKIPHLIETIARLANHKHVIFYMHDLKLQKALSDLNWVGEIKSYDGDYLHINDSNFAGGKSNLYVEQTVTQEISKQSDGNYNTEGVASYAYNTEGVASYAYKKKITIEYKNPQPFGVWLNGINRDYVRFYVPKGSKLISSKGSEDAVNTIEDLDKTVFEAFIQVRPQNSRKLEIEYSFPYQPKDEYKLLIQKQPGAKDFHYKIKINGSQKADFKLVEDREFKFDI